MAADDKKITPLEVEIDELSLSILGWEFTNFQARLVTEDYGVGNVFYSGAASAEIRFHPDDWTVRHIATDASDISHLPIVVWQLRSRSRGPLMGYQQVFLPLEPKEVRAPKMISASLHTWEGTGRRDPQDLYLWVGGVDWEYIPGWRSEPAFKWQDVSYEVVDYTTRPGVKVDIKESSVRVRDNATLEVTVRGVCPLGTADELLAAAIDSDDFYGDPDLPAAEQAGFVVQAPDVHVLVFDETGFLLGSREASNYRWVKVEDGGKVPTRDPSFIVRLDEDLDDYAGAVARVQIRIQDPA